MEITDIFNLKGHRIKVPQFERDILPELFVKLGYKTGVEIGVYKADYIEKFLKAGLKMYGIDPWRIYDEYQPRRGQERQDFLYEHAKRVVEPYGEQCKLIRATSMEASKLFENESLDFVYIDGNHAFKYIVQDLWEWTKKIKKGGIISGHDYANNAKGLMDKDVLHVKHAVEAWVGVARIQKWFIIGKAIRTAPRGDRTKSWLWIKQ